MYMKLCKRCINKAALKESSKNRIPMQDTSIDWSGSPPTSHQGPVVSLAQFGGAYAYLAIGLQSASQGCFDVIFKTKCIL